MKKLLGYQKEKSYYIFIDIQLFENFKATNNLAGRIEVIKNRTRDGFKVFSIQNDDTSVGKVQMFNKKNATEVTISTNRIHAVLHFLEGKVTQEKEMLNRIHPANTGTIKHKTDDGSKESEKPEKISTFTLIAETGENIIFRFALWSEKLASTSAIISRIGVPTM